MKILIGMSNGTVESDLRSLLEELDEAQVIGVAQSSSMVLDLASRLDPDIIVLHEHLGPDPALQTIRDLGARHPSVAVLEVSAERTPAIVIRAMEAGARGVVAHPFAFDDLSAKVTSANDWSRQMKRILAGAIAQASSARGKVLAVVGAKGGVGTTTLATHLALDHLTANPNRRVCVVDLDLEKGDVSAVLDVRQAVSIADLAKVHQDLSGSIVNDAVVQHECGLNLLLGPADVRLTELITAEALRPIFALLRREFDLVLVDGGGSVSPAQASVVELADETIVVTTADVLAVRAMRKRILAWEALGVTDESSLRIIVNKVDRTSIFPASAVAQLTSAQVLDAVVPLSTRALEPAMNERDPRAVTEVAWWRLMTQLRRELDLEDARPVEKGSRKGRARRPEEPEAADADEPVRGGRRGRRRGRPAPADVVDTVGEDALTAADDTAPEVVEVGGRRRREAGQVALENVVLLPLILFIALAAWQVVTIGLTFVMSGNASRVAAREYSVTGSQASAQAAARERSPWAFDDLTVSVDGDRVTVRMHIPASGPASLRFPQELTSTRSMVSER
ncbi:AAA family ATPase [Arthrobacter sp. NEB 688]|uniref:AAA family ATPase n=1 Tax=Arthrobacter sp. NEB 688 TaxID=904039 RepID=UPI001566F319|nr:AAA family ATPase [Arthrobacter sp. NEB 688]QKE85410.1 AAA family ATPase [Arthrobacter sp. NEB 688]